MGQGQSTDKEVEDLKYQLSQLQKKQDNNLSSAKQLANEKNDYEAKLKEYRGWMNICEANILSSKEKIDQHILSANLCRQETENLKKELEEKEKKLKVAGCSIHYTRQLVDLYKKEYPDFKNEQIVMPDTCKPYI